MKQLISSGRKAVASTSFIALMSLAGALFASSASASSCENTPWQQSNGRTCASLGLDSGAARCQNGVVTYCDDTKDAIRICSIKAPCDGKSLKSLNREWQGWIHKQSGEQKPGWTDLIKRGLDKVR